MAEEVTKKQREAKKHASIENAKIIQQQKQEKTQKEKEKQIENEKKSQAEIETLKNSIWLNEDWNATVRKDGKGEHRHIPYNFKGFKKDQLQQILDTQKNQVIEKQVCNILYILTFFFFFFDLSFCYPKMNFLAHT